jgi:molybdopterin converting factor small subunit
VTIELVGMLRHHAGRGELLMAIPDRLDVISLLRELEEKHGILEGLLLGEDHESVRRNLLVLVNGREIGVLDGLATLLSDGDRLTLLPVSHGG